MGFVFISGCQTIKEVAQLRNVDFSIDRVSNVSLSGIEMERVRSYNDLSVLDAARIGSAVVRKELPVEFQLHLMAENPQENSVNARLVQLEWTLFLEDQRTVSGMINDEQILLPGQPKDIPLLIQLDLFDFFNESARDLVELVLSVAGVGGAPKNIKIEALPTIQTPLGPIRYPRPITVLSRDVG